MTEKRAAELLADNLTALYGYAFDRLHDKSRADELASDMAYAIITAAPHLQKEEAFWGYAWKIAERTFYRFLRQTELTTQTVEYRDETVGECCISPEQAYIEQESEREEIGKIRRELSLLQKTRREISVAYYVDQKSCSEIAKEQHISVEMVKYHLFRTRKQLKEGLYMSRTLGEKSYNPGTFRLDFWGDRNQYSRLFHRKLPGSIVLAAYEKPMTAQELSLELGVSMPYLEDELDILEAAGLLKRTGERVRTDIVILTDDYDKAFMESTAAVVAEVARSVYDKTAALLPLIRRLDFCGNDFEDNRLLFGLLNLAIVNAFSQARERSPLGAPKKWPLGCYGWIFGYDNDAIYHPFHDVILEQQSRDKTVRFSVENYKIIESAQLLDYDNFDANAEALCDAILGKEADADNPALPWLIEHRFVLCENRRLSANFPVFSQTVYEAVCTLFADVIREIADGMMAVSDQAEILLRKHVPSHLKDQCGDIAKIRHRLNVGALLLEELVKEQKLTVPQEEIPLCIFGVYGE